MRIQFWDIPGLTFYAKPDAPLVASPWANDAIAMTDADGIGHYTATAAAGTYSIFEQLGGSPAATDAPAMATSNQIDEIAADAAELNDTKIPAISGQIASLPSGVWSAVRTENNTSGTMGEVLDLLYIDCSMDWLTIPGPAEPGLATVFAYVRDLAGVPQEGVELCVQPSGDSVGDFVITSNTICALSNSSGLVNLDVIANTQMRAYIPKVGLDEYFTSPSVGSLNLADLV